MYSLCLSIFAAEAYNPTVEWIKVESSKVVREVKPSSLFKAKKKKGSIRVVCISDTHGLVKDLKIPDGDVLIHAGDFTNAGEMSQIMELNELLGRLPHKHKIVIAGNHDISFQEGWYEANWKRFNPYMESVRACRAALTNCTYLEDSEVVIEGYKFYGSPWQPSFCNWAFNLERGAPLKEKWNKIPTDTEILITHGPPLGYGDLIPPPESKRTGCLDLLNAVEQIAPLYHIFGHVHEGYGVTSNGVTTFINASTCTDAYKPTNEPIVFDLPSKTAEKEGFFSKLFGGSKSAKGGLTADDNESSLLRKSSASSPSLMVIPPFVPKAPGISSTLSPSLPSASAPLATIGEASMVDAADER
jgi:hypothetical protein